jgi:hypothetical protein
MSSSFSFFFLEGLSSACSSSSASSLASVGHGGVFSPMLLSCFFSSFFGVWGWF